MFDVKSIFASSTFWGAVIAAIPTVAGFFGWTVTGEDAATATTLLTQIVNGGITLFGLAMTIRGRMAARKIATLTGK